VLDHPPEEDNRTLGGNRGVFVARCKRYIQFRNDDSSSDEEGNNDSRLSTPPRVSQPLSPMPSTPRRDPSPTAPPPLSLPPRKDPSPMAPPPVLLPSKRDIPLCHRQ
jgi:hypothetical protein